MASPNHPIGAIPPPRGVEANIVDPPTRTAGTIILHTMCLSFVTVTLVIRIYTRQFITHQLGWDDCRILSSAKWVDLNADKSQIS